MFEWLRIHQLDCFSLDCSQRTLGKIQKSCNSVMGTGNTDVGCVAGARNALRAYSHLCAVVVPVLPRQGQKALKLKSTSASMFGCQALEQFTGLLLIEVLPIRAAARVRAPQGEPQALRWSTHSQANCVLVNDAADAGRPFNLIVLLAFTAHYVNRVFIYSLRHYRFPRAGRRDTVPLLVPVTAFMFCFVNGLAQSISGSHFNYSSEMRGLRYLFPRWIPVETTGVEMFHRTSLWDVLALLRFFMGLALFIYGMTVNILADEHLLQLKSRARDSMPQGTPASQGTAHEGLVTLRRSSRIAAKKDGDDIVTFKYPVHPSDVGVAGYKIPRAGWFQQVSCANYWGEICEWFGYAIMCNSTVSFAFALFTLMFLGCRGVQTHTWYKGRFGDKYPKNRHAIIPYIL